MKASKEHKPQQSRVIESSATNTVLQKRAKVVIDNDGLQVYRDGDFKYLNEYLPEFGGTVYRHMSPKNLRLNVARAFLMAQHSSNEIFLSAQKQLMKLQNQLTGFEYYTEHLGKQFAGEAKSNRLLNKGEYDSILIAANQAGKDIDANFIDIELDALAEDYMYHFLSTHSSDAMEFIRVSQSKQLTLPAIWIFTFMKSRIEETAKKLSVKPDSVLELLQQRVNPIMAHKAMGNVAYATEQAFVKGNWIGPTNIDGTPNRTYYDIRADL